MASEVGSFQTMSNAYISETYIRSTNKRNGDSFRSTWRQKWDHFKQCQALISQKLIYVQPISEKTIEFHKYVYAENCR